MNRIRTTKYTAIWVSLSLGMLFTSSALWAQYANHALHFDGENDYIFLKEINGLHPKSDYSIELLFSMDPDTEPADPYRRLFYIGDDEHYFEMGVIDAHLFVSWVNAYSNHQHPLNIDRHIIPGWHYLAVIQREDRVMIFLDCEMIWQANRGEQHTQHNKLFIVGHGLSEDYSGYYGWQGEMDEIRLWSRALDPAEVLEYCHRRCPFAGDEPGLILYWRLDQGIAEGDNTSTDKYAFDATVYDNHGDLSFQFDYLNPPGFLLDGPVSNFVESTIPIHTPQYLDHTVFLSDVSQSNLLHKICNGTQFHFAVSSHASQLMPPIAAPGVSVYWEYSDNMGGQWHHIQPLAPGSAVFNGFNFVPPPFHPAIYINCAQNTQGYTDRMFRAVIGVEWDDGSGICYYYTTPATMRIYCPVVITNLTANPPGPLCEGDEVVFNVEVIAQPLPTGTNDVGIAWFFSEGGGAAQALTGPDYNDLAQITFPATGTYHVGLVPVTFKVTIGNGACPLVSRQITIVVDPMPICGTIDASPLGQPLNLIQTMLDPLTYEICPGNDAILQVIDPFMHCIPVWQYAYGSQGTWHDLGTGNTIQNTNILPQTGPAGYPSVWPSNETSISYRIECRPYSYPNAACDPCYSNEVFIKLIPDPDKPTITAQNPICKGASSHMQVTNPDPALDYVWYHNDLVVGYGPEYMAYEAGNYWVEATNQCDVTLASDIFELIVCQTLAIIDCPMPDCPCVGATIMLSGLHSMSTCGHIISYSWEWDSGTLIADNGGYIQHIPHEEGTTYWLTVSDVYGCMATTSITVIPCK